MKRAVLIRPDGSVFPVAIQKPNELEQLQHYVGGYIEALPHSLNRWPNFTVFMDEDGRDKRLPRNELASAVFLPAHMQIGSIVGNVLVMGPVVDGETQGLTVEQADIFLSPEGEDILNGLVALT